MVWSACVARAALPGLLSFCKSRVAASCRHSKKGLNLTFLLVRGHSGGKQESYFSAIGGDSDDPPPDLTPAQVTAILQANQLETRHASPLVASIQCNQLASNSPIEDRLRVSRCTQCPVLNETLMLGVFDGHGGGTCAELVSCRLFQYIALALASDPVAFVTESHHQQQQSFLTDLVSCPSPDTATVYDERSSFQIRVNVDRNEKYFLSRFAEKMRRCKLRTVAEKISDAFRQCDSDLSEEIKDNLTSSKSNLLKHFYLSLAVSGCCANVIVIQESGIYVANSGDCRAVLTFDAEDGGEKRCVPLSFDHNSDNVKELNRILGEHPAREQNNIIRYNRLLGQLMPLRAFGDFGYKWDVSRIKSVGLTKAFGPHVIPPFYHTPPYLTCEPEVTHYDLAQVPQNCDSFIILATDGLWEQFESSRVVSEYLWKHRSLTKGQSDEASSLAHEDMIDLPPAEKKPDQSQGIDANRATSLIRSALTQPFSDHDQHLDDAEPRRHDHQKLVSFLTLPASVVRNFRDDISLIVVRF